MLLDFREKYQILYAHFLKNNSDRAYLDKFVDLNTAALSNMIMTFFIKKISFLSSCLTYG